TLIDQAAPDSPLRRAREQRLRIELAALGVPPEAVRWLDDPHEIPPGALVGCVVSNELVDALPVHLVEKRDGALAEVYVAVDERTGQLVERLDEPSSQAVSGYLDAYHIPWRGYADGWRAEVRLAAEPWLRDTTAPLSHGYVLTIDYGDTARGLYTRDRRRGTLAAYSRHQLAERPLAQPGHQDLTAHVNFTALIASGRLLGLRLAGLTTQADFLKRLGVRAEAEALAQQLYPAAETERHTDRGQADYLRKRTLLGAVATLLNPHGLGGFRVLIQQRGAPGTSRRLFGLGPQNDS
ncbi:MAG TPA: class I SAM-dependent methyltransferase, partial [Ktedonobacterales bacterium]|nr:class I SAM-dependent methyltransferase [Ktedonobacterales bacterium]